MTSMPSTLRRSELRLKTPLVAAQTPLEASIVAIFKDTLELDEVGAEDSFFELGGDSLSAQILALNLLKRTAQEFNVSQLHNHNTPRSIAALIQDGAPELAA